MIPAQTDTITSLVARVFRIDAVTWGDPKQNYLARFQGQLWSEDSELAYDQLAESLRSLEITPLFRLEKGKQVIILVPGIAKSRPSNPWVNAIFFALTVLSVLFVGLYNASGGLFPANLSQFGPFLRQYLGLGVAFTVSLLGILLAHEFGHYLVSRFHKTAASLPYFIPLPFPPFGTMGAVIFQKESHKNKRILLDIGMAGPLSGMVIAIPVLVLGLLLSRVEALPLAFPRGQGIEMEGNSILYLLIKYVIYHQWLPTPASYGSISPILYWVRYFFTGMPFPYGGLDVSIHPIAFAGWAGLLVTSLNLIPAGQLDGGHILRGLVGRNAIALLPVILISLALLGLVWPGWWLWAFLIFFLGRTYAEPLDQITPLDTRRKIMAVGCLILFFLIFTPVPLALIVG